jgi:hypothetical protein
MRNKKKKQESVVNNNNNKTLQTIKYSRHQASHAPTKQADGVSKTPILNREKIP